MNQLELEMPRLQKRQFDSWFLSRYLKSLPLEYKKDTYHF